MGGTVQFGRYLGDSLTKYVVLRTTGLYNMIHVLES